VEAVDEEIDISDDTVDVENTGGSKAEEIADKVMKMIDAELGEVETSKPTMSEEYIQKTTARHTKPSFRERVVPSSGNMTFSAANTFDALSIISDLLGNSTVNLTISWELV
jgi:hypothetical protein